MNCPNCGAAMKLRDQRKHLVCDYCTTFQFLSEESNCPDRINILGDQNDYSCPVCNELLQRGALDGREVLRCRQCRGIMTSNDTFADVVQMRRRMFTGQRGTPSAIDPAELKRELACPVCRKPLDTHPYYGPGNVVVDTCDHCAIIWLDHGELAVIEQAPGRV